MFCFSAGESCQKGVIVRGNASIFKFSVHLCCDCRVKMMGLYSSGALGGVEVLDGGLVGGELTAHVLSAQAAAHAAATAAAAAHQQQQIAVQQISKFLHVNSLQVLAFFCKVCQVVDPKLWPRV